MTTDTNHILDQLSQGRDKKDRDSRLQILIQDQIHRLLDDIERRMAELEAAIEVEQDAIHENTRVIDFIDTLDEDMIYGADGSIRADVASVMRTHGYDDPDKRSASEVMHILQTIRTDKHDDNVVRQDRIESYQDQHGRLRDAAAEIAEALPDGSDPRATARAVALAERQPPEVNVRSTVDALGADSTHFVEASTDSEIAVRVDKASQSFSM